MSDTLDAITALEKALQLGGTLAEAEKWWSMTLTIEATLFHDPHYSRHEKEIVGRLKAAVSLSIRQIRESWPAPSVSSAQVASGALRSSIERRTAGADGWPMRR